MEMKRFLFSYRKKKRKKKQKKVVSFIHLGRTKKKKNSSDSNNAVPPASAQVATSIVAQVLVMPTVVPIFVSPREKPEKFNRLNFKKWQ